MSNSELLKTLLMHMKKRKMTLSGICKGQQHIRVMLNGLCHFSAYGQMMN